MSTYMYTAPELARERALWVGAGVLLGAAVAVVLLAIDVIGRPTGPVIERQTETETVARIHTRMYGFPRECVVRIDHKSRTWSIHC